MPGCWQLPRLQFELAAVLGGAGGRSGGACSHATTSPSSHTTPCHFPFPPHPHPAGPRKKNEGVEDEDQGVLSAEPTATGGARLRVTLLAAGFVVGPSGSSVRQLSHATGADVRSWNVTWQEGAPGGGLPPRARHVRTFVVEVGAGWRVPLPVAGGQENCFGLPC